VPEVGAVIESETTASCSQPMIPMQSLFWDNAVVLLYFIDPTVRKIRNEASSCPGIFSSTLRFYNVASFSGSPFPHLLDGHRKLVGCSAIQSRVQQGHAQGQ